MARRQCCCSRCQGTELPAAKTVELDMSDAVGVDDPELRQRIAQALVEARPVAVTDSLEDASWRRVVGFRRPCPLSRPGRLQGGFTRSARPWPRRRSASGSAGTWWLRSPRRRAWRPEAPKCCALDSSPRGGPGAEQQRRSPTLICWEASGGPGPCCLTVRRTVRAITEPSCGAPRPPSSGHRTADDLTHDLVGAGPDARDTGIHPVLGDGALAHVTQPAVHLDGSINDRALHFG